MQLVGPATIITLDQQTPLIEEGGVVIKDNLIKELGVYEELKEKYQDKIENKINTQGKLIMPGMINTHFHLYSTFARGMALEGAAPQNFEQILENLWWKLDQALDYEAIYYSALLAIIEGVKNGCTTIFDHHASPNAISASLDKIAEAVLEVGIRACLAYEISDRDGLEKAEEGLAENRRFIEYCQHNQSDLLTASCGLHALFTLSDQTLEQVSGVVNELECGVHIHLAEGAIDQKKSLADYGLTVVERLERFELCNSQLLAAHGVHLQEEDLAILARCGANLLHNPASNMNNAVGYAPLLKMLEQGVLVGHGTDGMTTDLFESMKVANLLHKHSLADPRVGWEEIPEITFTNNQRIAAKFFERPLGILKVGAYADLIAIDYRPTTPLTADNFYSHLLFGVSGAMVDLTMVNGELLMENRELKGLDEERIYDRARVKAEEIWARR